MPMPPELERISDYVDHYAKLCPGREALVLDPLLVNFKVPKAVIIRDMLPMLPIGKVNRVTLRKQALAEAEGRR